MEFSQEQGLRSPSTKEKDRERPSLNTLGHETSLNELFNGKHVNQGVRGCVCCKGAMCQLKYQLKPFKPVRNNLDC